MCSWASSVLSVLTKNPQGQKGLAANYEESFHAMCFLYPLPRISGCLQTPVFKVGMEAEGAKVTELAILKLIYFYLVNNSNTLIFLAILKYHLDEYSGLWIP